VRFVEEVEPTKVNIDWEKDVRVDTFRCGGKGGQNVNKTDSGVRMVYEPLRISVESRTERSQYINKEICRKRLASLVADYYLPESVRVKDAIKFGKAYHQVWEQDIKTAFAKVLT
jgi:protein subunit release factor B